MQNGGGVTDGTEDRPADIEWRGRLPADHADRHRPGHSPRPVRTVPASATAHTRDQRRLHEGVRRSGKLRLRRCASEAARVAGWLVWMVPCLTTTLATPASITISSAAS